MSDFVPAELCFHHERLPTHIAHKIGMFVVAGHCRAFKRQGQHTLTLRMSALAAPVLPPVMSHHIVHALDVLLANGAGVFVL